MSSSNPNNLYLNPMRASDVPLIGPRYWVALCVVSMFGCNMGDFSSHFLHLGHWHGLLPMAIIFGLIIWAERRSTRPTEAWYWLGVILLRAAATNISDLMTGDLALPFSWVIVSLETLLVLVLIPAAARVPDSIASTLSRPVTNGWYWLSMLTAGTLGTAIGDCMSDNFDLGLAPASVLLGAILMGVLAFGRRMHWATKPSYWIAVVAVRAFGTTAGDFVAFGPFDFGLPISTAATGVIFVVILLYWRRPESQRSLVNP